MPKPTVIRSVVITTIFIAGVAGCSEKGTTTAPGSSASATASSAQDIIGRANAAMQKTTFHSTGTTTSFNDRTVETWWDPAQGMHTKITSRSAESQETFCKDGTNYLSTAMLADSLRQSGKASITIPSDLTKTYITMNSGQGCDSNYKIPDIGTLAPDKNTTIRGTKTTAVVANSGPTQDVYQVAAQGTPYILRLDSTRDGRTSTTVYDSFGAAVSIALPPADRTMSLEDFKRRVSTAG